MARRRFFNPRQPRDSRGRWTSGGGSSRGARRRARRKTLTPAQQRVKSQKLKSFQRVQSGTLIGAGTGFFLAGGPGVVAGAALGAAAGVRANRRGKRRRAR